MHKNNNDRELAVNLASYDQLTFQQDYNRYADEMYLYAMKILNKKEVCEDIVQDVFIDLWSKKDNKEIEYLKAYLLKCVKYKIFKYFRDVKLPKSDLTRLNIIDMSMDIDRKLEFDELNSHIRQCVSKLPARRKQIFMLSRYQNRSNSEIAKELNISIQAVKNQISMAISFIRNNLRTEEMIFFFSFLLSV